MYIGIYRIHNETLIINIKGASNQEDIYYKIEKDSTFMFVLVLYKNAFKLDLVIPPSKDPYAIPLFVSSFIWGHSFDQSKGIFVKK